MKKKEAIFYEANSFPSLGPEILELKVFIDNIVDTLVGDFEDDVKLSVEEDDEHRYVTLKIFGRMLH